MAYRVARPILDCRLAGEPRCYAASAMRTDTQKIGVAIAQLPSILVIAQAASFYLYVVRGRLALGRWPSLYRS